MPVLAQSGTASPQTSTSNPVDVNVSAVLVSTDLTPTPVKVSYTSQSTSATVVGNPQSVTIPAATSFLSPAVLPVPPQQVRVTSTGARPAIVSIDVKVWLGAVGDPAGPAAQTVATVGLL